MPSNNARLTLVRHGESIWNEQDRFTGWVDVSLSRKGMQQAVGAGALLREMMFDVAFTSTLLRAQDTLYEILKQNYHCDQYMRIHELSSEWYEHFVPSVTDVRELKIYISEKLNERYYGDLQGQNKQAVQERYGAEQVHVWRRSYATPPPAGESLAMTAARTIPYYRQKIRPHLERGAAVLISAHGNSLRALIMHIEQLTPEEILDYELSTGVPHVITFDDDMQIVARTQL